MRQNLLAAEYRKNGKRPPGRPRSEQARQAILRTTLKILGKNGFSDFKIEEVAARASVGKATVYRWWPNKGALIADAFASSTTRKLRFPDTAASCGATLIPICFSTRCTAPSTCDSSFSMIA